MSNYNFDAKTEREQLYNYELYKEIYADMLQFNRLRWNFESLSKDFKNEFDTSFSEYFIFLDNFAELNVLKNYLILLSILFQIIGLVTLASLF